MSGARYPRLVLLLAAERCELQLNRTGMRQYSVRVRQGDSTVTMGSEEGIPSTRMAAIDRALELGEQLGLVDPVIRQRSQARRALARTEPCPKRDSAGVPCEKRAGHRGPCECPEALAAFRRARGGA